VREVGGPLPPQRDHRDLEGGMTTLGVCPIDSNHQITQVSASREGYKEYCAQCRKWRWTIDLRPIRAEIRALGGDPDVGAGVLERKWGWDPRVGEC